MTLLTGQPRVLARQWKGTQVVIEIGILPIRGVMTSGAIRAKLTIMFIILLVAGVAIHRGAFELSIHMAGLTINFCVFAFQFECREIVIELCGCPAFCGMTFRAVQTESALVRLILEMTR
jgi:hypothetical protein